MINGYVKPLENIIVYTAGFFDGEGSITIAHSHHDKNASREWYHTLQFTITNTNYSVMQWLIDNWKLGSITEHEDIRNYLPNNSFRKQGWHWYLSANEASFVLDCMFPYLIVKKGESYICTSFQKWKHYDSCMYGKLRPDVSFAKELQLRDLLLQQRQTDLETAKINVEKILGFDFCNGAMKRIEQMTLL
jgi:hypothetical protein